MSIESNLGNHQEPSEPSGQADEQRKYGGEQLVSSVGFAMFKETHRNGRNFEIPSVGIVIPGAPQTPEDQTGDVNNANS